MTTFVQLAGALTFSALSIFVAGAAGSYADRYGLGNAQPLFGAAGVLAILALGLAMV